MTLLALRGTCRGGLELGGLEARRIRGLEAQSLGLVLWACSGLWGELEAVLDGLGAVLGWHMCSTCPEAKIGGFFNEPP